MKASSHKYQIIHCSWCLVFNLFELNYKFLNFEIWTCEAFIKIQIFLPKCRGLFTAIYFKNITLIDYATQGITISTELHFNKIIISWRIVLDFTNHHSSTRTKNVQNIIHPEILFFICCISFLFNKFTKWKNK